MFSAFTTAGAQVTVDALTLGAEDYVAKPSDLSDPETGAPAVKRELVAKIKLLTPSATAKLSRRPVTVPKTPLRPTPGRVDVIAIGSSTGGPNALADLFARFPANLPVPILLVQHMPALFTSHLAGRLRFGQSFPDS